MYNQEVFETKFVIFVICFPLLDHLYKQQADNSHLAGSSTSENWTKVWGNVAA